MLVSRIKRPQNTLSSFQRLFCRAPGGIPSASVRIRLAKPLPRPPGQICDAHALTHARRGGALLGNDNKKGGKTVSWNVWSLRETHRNHRTKKHAPDKSQIMQRNRCQRQYNTDPLANPAHSLLILERGLSKRIDNEPEGPRSNVGVENKKTPNTQHLNLPDFFPHEAAPPPPLPQARARAPAHNMGWIKGGRKAGPLIKQKVFAVDGQLVRPHPASCNCEQVRPPGLAVGPRVCLVL